MSAGTSTLLNTGRRIARWSSPSFARPGWSSLGPGSAKRSADGFARPSRFNIGGDMRLPRALQAGRVGPLCVTTYFRDRTLCLANDTLKSTFGNRRSETQSGEELREDSR